jgi:insulysin
MRDLQVQPDRFKVAKDRNLRSFRNWIYQQPYHQVGEYSRYMNAQTMWLNEESLVELENLAIEDVKNFFPKVLRQTHIEMLVHGNLHKEVRPEIPSIYDVTYNLYLQDALKFANLMESILTPKPLPPTQWNIRRSLIIPEGGRYVWTRPLLDPKNVNSVIEYTLFIGEQTDKRLKNLLTLFSQLTEE